METTTANDYSVQKTLEKIKEIRSGKGISIESMATELQMSSSAYSKLENNQTKLTLDKFFTIAQTLKKPIEELLEIKAERIYKQNLYDNSTINQDFENLHQESKELVQQLIKQHEQENTFKRRNKFFKTIGTTNLNFYNFVYQTPKRTL